MVSTESVFLLELRDDKRIVYSNDPVEFKLLTRKPCKCCECQGQLNDYWYSMITDTHQSELTDGLYSVLFGYGSFGEKIYFVKKLSEDIYV